MSIHHRGARLLAAVAVVVATLATGAGGASAGREDPPGHGDANHCFTDLGVDFNEVLGYREQIVNRYCLEATAGEHWRPMALWIVSPTNDSFPEGYVPSAPTPLEDLVAKLVEVRVVIDGGTRHERTFTFPASKVVRTDVTFDRLEPGAPPLPTLIAAPRMRPLPVGEHTREVIWVLSDQHCDGLAPIAEENCLPAGEVSFFPRPLIVTPPATGS